MVESARRADGRYGMVPFYFRRRISLDGLGAGYVGACLEEARAALIDAQCKPRDFDDLWDLRNGLTLYVVLLGEIARERIIRYRSIFGPCVCMAAYLGHDRILDAFVRCGLPIESFEWSTLDVFLAAILGRQQKTVRKLLKEYPALKDRRYVWYGNAGAFCAGYGSLAILRYLRKSGIPLAASARLDRQKAEDPVHFGSALLLAVQRRRKSLAADLVVHGEYCEWKNLRSWSGCDLSFFGEAVRNGFLDLARLYLENGWLDIPSTEEDFWDLFKRCGGCGEPNALRTFRFLEDIFPCFDAKLIARKHEKELWSDLSRYCGCSQPDQDQQLEWSAKRTFDDVRTGFVSWIESGRHDMVRFSLDETPELLLDVWADFRDGIVAAYDGMPESVGPCSPYLVRFAESMHIGLFRNEAVRRFWTEPHGKGERDVATAETFAYDEGLGGWFLPKEHHERYSRALCLIGRDARRMMDDPFVNPNEYLEWNNPFSVRLARHADWNTYKGWLLRGMEIYHLNQDDPGSFGLEVKGDVICHLLHDLEHRPWLSSDYNGNPLRVAATAGNLRAVKELVGAGCPVNFGADLEMEQHTTPLRYALKCGHDDIARWLYRRGGLNVKDGIVFPMPVWIKL